MTVLAVGDESVLRRPCVDCGVRTGRFCDMLLTGCLVRSGLMVN